MVSFAVAESEQTSRFLTSQLIKFQVILILRTWAVWNRRLWVAYMLFGLLGLNIILGGALLTRAMKALTCMFLPICPIIVIIYHPVKVEPKPYPEYGGCMITTASSIQYVNLVALMVLEGGEHAGQGFFRVPQLTLRTAILIIMSISAFRAC